MVAFLFAVRMLLASWFAGSIGHRMVGVLALVGGGMAVYFPLAWLLGGMDRAALSALMRRKKRAGSDAV